MAELATIATIATIASGALTAAGTIAAGNAAAAQAAMKQQAFEFEAKQLEVQATEEKAAAQQDMLQLRRQKNLALSSLQARAAGSGFSATDPTSLALADEISTYGTVQEQMALYGGSSRESQANLAAAGRRFSGAAALEEGRAKQAGSYLSGAGTILGSISGMAGKYATRPSGFTPYRTTGRTGD